MGASLVFRRAVIYLHFTKKAPSLHPPLKKGKSRAERRRKNAPSPPPPLPRRERGARGYREAALSSAWLPLSLLGRGGWGVRGFFLTSEPLADGKKTLAGGRGGTRKKSKGLASHPLYIE
jgi:hypothetical protein